MIRELLAQQGGAKIELWPMFQMWWSVFVGNPWLCVMCFVVLTVAAAIPAERSRRRHRRRRHAARWRGVEWVQEAAPVAGELGAFRSAVGLLTPTEAQFYPVLVRACGADREGGPRVMTKVRLVDIVQPANDSPTRHADFLRLSQKHVDFVVVAGDRMVPMRVVELDDASHERADRVERDRLVDEVLRRAGVPITHVPVERCRDLGWVRERIGVG